MMLSNKQNTAACWEIRVYVKISMNVKLLFQIEFLFSFIWYVMLKMEEIRIHV